MFLRAVLPTPILNTKNFLHVFGDNLPFDGQGLVRELEAIAFPNTFFHVVGKHPGGIFEVKTPAYPTQEKIYIDERFGEEVKEIKTIRYCCPSVEEIQFHLFSLMGAKYIWGGNYSAGISEILSFYPPKKKLTESEKMSWIFQGVDCSGLLYEVTRGYTPRNTSWIATFGKAVSVEEILPLDAIIFREETGGYHVVFSLDAKRSIESRGEKGVVMTDLQDRLEEIALTRSYAGDWNHDVNTFTIRRWHPSLL